MSEPIGVDKHSVARDYDWKFMFLMPECPKGFVPLGGVAIGVNEIDYELNVNDKIRCVNQALTVAADASKEKNIL